MPQPIPARVCQPRHFAELARCLSFAAETRGESQEAARHERDAARFDARAVRLPHTPFDAVLDEASADRLDRVFSERRA